MKRVTDGIKDNVLEDMSTSSQFLFRNTSTEMAASSTMSKKTNTMYYVMPIQGQEKQVYLSL